MRTREQAESSTLSRRGFVRLGAGAMLAAAALPLVEACVPAAPGAPASGGAPAGGGASTSRVQLPAYVPFQGPKPDFPPSADGIVPAGYLTFPQSLVKSSSGPVGKSGDEVSFLSYSI